jgi:hypothetical protein
MIYFLNCAGPMDLSVQGAIIKSTVKIREKYDAPLSIYFA